MGIIPVKNSYFALSEQHALTVKIIIKILVLIRADMIRLNIGENANVKSKAGSPVEHKSLGRNFHDYTVASCLRHLCEIFLDQIGFRRSIS